MKEYFFACQKLIIGYKLLHVDQEDDTKMLTDRERQIMDLVVSGFTTREISKALYISETTVVTHKQNVKEKLNARNSCHCVSLYLQKSYQKKS